jgi:dolichyl-phosphate beta-glucosyltransferase
MSKKIISVIIPTKNQGDSVGETIDHIKDVAKKLDDFDVEIIFVNDRSTDNSVEVAEAHLRDYKNHRILHTDKNYVGNGKGLAVELGMSEAKGDYRLFMDADNSTRFEEIKKLIPYFDKYDIILGTRYSNKITVPSGNWFKSFFLAVIDVIQVLIYGHAKRYTAKKKQGRLRELVSRGGNLAFTTLLGQSFTDSRCGFKMYNAESAAKIFPLCRIKTWDFDTEALVLARRFGYKMIEVPVDWYDDAEASNFKIKDMINAFKAIFQIYWYTLTRKYGKAKNSGKFLLRLVLAALLIGSVVYFSYFAFCQSGSKAEKEYVLGKTNAYIYGHTYCPNSRYKKVSERSIKKLPKDTNLEITSKNESKELENQLNKNFSSFDRFIARNGNESFFIYSIKCNCGAK